MSDAELKPMVELTAVRRGYYRDELIEPGRTFMFDPNPRVPGAKVKFPSWAKPAAEAKVMLAAEKAKSKAVDTKSAAAAKAARAKSAALSGSDLA